VAARTGPFRYLADPVFIASLVIYPINRFVLKPHHIGGWFTHGYLNDVLCLPMFVPITLYAQRLLRVRSHDGYPRVWEMVQLWIIYSVLFQAVLPHFPHTYRTAGDPWDMLAYAAGGILAKLVWNAESRQCRQWQSDRDNSVP